MPVYADRPKFFGLVNVPGGKSKAIDEITTAVGIIGIERERFTGERASREREHRRFPIFGQIEIDPVTKRVELIKGNRRLSFDFDYTAHVSMGSINPSLLTRDISILERHWVILPTTRKLRRGSIS